jgi:excisionase family DNA binding protein
MTVNETAAMLGLSEQSVYLLCAAGKIAHYRMGLKKGVIVISKDDANAYMESCRVGSKAATPKVRKYVPQCF